MATKPSFFLLLLAFFSSWKVTSQQDLGYCKKYFNFKSENDVSVLSGNWITLGSTRRVFSCNNIVGRQKANEVIGLHESWMVPGIMGIWKHEVTSDVTSRPTHMEVTKSGFDSVLTYGRLAVGKYGDKLLLVQCTYFPWSLMYPMASVTVLTRNLPADPAKSAKEIFEQFNVPSSISSFYTVKHDGCDALPRAIEDTESSTSQLFAFNGVGQRVRSSPKWRIRSSPDRNVIF